MDTGHPSDPSLPPSDRAATERELRSLERRMSGIIERITASVDEVGRRVHLRELDSCHARYDVLMGVTPEEEALVAEQWREAWNRVTAAVRRSSS